LVPDSGSATDRTVRSRYRFGVSTKPPTEPDRPDPFRRPERLPLVCPSILAANFATLGADCEIVCRAGGDSLHLDVMDGHFVPNLTLGPAVCRSLRKAMPSVHLDVHLMVTDPDAFVEPFADAGADHVTFHIEAVDDPTPLVERIRSHGMSAGIAISPPTAMARLERWVELPDLLLVMTVNPGFAGQSFIHEALAKVRVIRSGWTLRPDQRLQVDGGVNPQTAVACRDAGADTLVAASAIFNSESWSDAIANLRGATSPASAR